MKKIKKFTLAAGLIGIGILAGRYIIKPPVKTEIKEVVKYVEVEVEKKKDTKDTTTTITETVRPDGTRETTTVITENETSTTESSRNTTNTVSTNIKTSTGSKITLGMLALKDVDSKGDIFYGVTGYFPIVGNLSLTGIVTTEKHIGAGIALSF